MRIVLLGSGSVATHLGLALQKSGNQILQVWSRTAQNVHILAAKLNTTSTHLLSDIQPDADLYLIAVKDDSITEIVHSLKISDRLLVHTSGSTDMNVLHQGSSNFGVIYPFQTFSKDREIDFSPIPIAIEGNSVYVTEQLELLTKGISNRVFKADSVQRRFMHISAVFACNFTNHLYAVAQHILEQRGLDFDLIKPLILETAQKVQYMNPINAQTGPAARQDLGTLNKHLDLLKEDSFLFDLYDKLSHHIIKYSKR